MPRVNIQTSLCFLARGNMHRMILSSATERHATSDTLFSQCFLYQISGSCVQKLDNMNIFSHGRETFFALYAFTLNHTIQGGGRGS